MELSFAALDGLLDGSEGSLIEIFLWLALRLVLGLWLRVWFLFHDLSLAHVRFVSKPQNFKLHHYRLGSSLDGERAAYGNSSI